MRIPPYKQTFKTKADQRASGALFNNCTIEIKRISRNDFHLIEVSYIQRTFAMRNQHLSVNFRRIGFGSSHIIIALTSVNNGFKDLSFLLGVQLRHDAFLHLHHPVKPALLDIL